MDESGTKNENNETEFYNFIVNITKFSNCETLLRKDSQAIYDVITKDYKKNIQLAASRGLNKAFICIYEIGARYRGLIPIDAFVRMNDPMKEKFETFKMESVLDRIKKRLSPFVVDVVYLNENELKNDNEISEAIIDSIIRSKDETPLPQESRLIGILISWEKNNK